MDAGEVRRPSHTPTVAEIGEFAVIDRFTRGRMQSAHTVLGPGDDAAIVAAPDARVVVTTDMLVEQRHFRLDWSSPVDVGRKAIAQNGADIAAMGARCTGFLVALGCPADTPIDVTDGLNEGLWQEATRAGASIVGGDLVQTEAVVVSITALGDLEGRSAVLRSGARPGDVVAVSGVLGRSAAGLAVLEAGVSGHRGLIDAHRVPTPDYEQGPLAARAGATSLTDVSDGLLADLGHIAQASAVSIDVIGSAMIVADEIICAADEVGGSALSWVLTGGEDHALAGTFPPDVILPDGWIAVGRVLDAVARSTVTVDGDLFDGAAGWSSFSRGGSSAPPREGSRSSGAVHDNDDSEGST
ncbi:MAG: thiamine-phosphate kinase [Rhodococcus sp. (in: high G+C Gram-positive bacteria)]